MARFSFLVPFVLSASLNNAQDSPSAGSVAPELPKDGDKSGNTASDGKFDKPNHAATERCKHGTFNEDTQSCHCFKGWATAGITDTLDFLEGVCEQFHCQSDEQCQDILHISDATCPVRNWNCYCSFKYAFWNMGHGYETNDRGGAECMGVMYAFSIFSTEWLWWFMQEAWKVFFVLAALALPFGRKRSICDHHTPSLWNMLRRCCGVSVDCPGTCVHQEGYSMDTFKDDLAWTLYFLDLCIWLYVFFATLYVVALFIWSIVLWAAVFVILLMTCLVGACGMCGEGMAGAGDLAGCNCCDGCCNADCCGDCCMVNAYHPADNFYYGGTFPYDPFWGYGGYGVESHDCCNCCGDQSCCGACCRPLAVLIYVFPIMPENAWGGFVGRFVFGTHKDTPPEEMYQGGNDIIEFFRMGWRRNADLHGNRSWRRQVHNFLVGDGQPGVGSDSSSAELLRDTRIYSDSSTESVVGGSRVLRVGLARALIVERSFDLEEDRCVPSSFEDYSNNICWICQSGNDEWDLWMSCRHVFCRDCSTQMLHRRMPCPLCRVASTTVLRGLRTGVPPIVRTDSEDS